MLCYPSAKLNQSANFKNHAKIVKTFKKQLNPNDTYDFRMTVHLGPGIRFDIAKSYWAVGAKGTQPSSYGLIVETFGTECQAVNLSTNYGYSGLCPGW